MNEQDNGTPEVPTGDTDTPPPTETIHADCVTKLADQQVTISEMRGEIDRLRYTQIMGDDHRLADFWAKAQELADSANHCDVFDDLAEALGGPRRQREYTVTVPVMGYVTHTVMATDADDAIDQSRYMDVDEGDIQNCDYDYYNVEAETN